MNAKFLSLLAGCCLAAVVDAADTNTPPSAGNPPPVPQRERFAGAVNRAQPLARVLESLTDEQRASFRSAMAGQRDQVRDLESQIAAARRDLLEASLAAKFDEAAVRQKAAAAADLEVDLNVLRAKAFSQIQPPLSADQLAKIRSAEPPTASDTVQPARRRRPAPANTGDENGLPPKQ